MTKIPVNIPEFVPNMSLATNKVQDTENKGDFGKILENQKKAEVQKQDNTPKEDVAESPEENTKEVDTVKENHEADVQKAEKEPEVKETAETETGTDTAKEESGESFTAEQMQMILPMLNVAVTDVKELLASELGITQEELNFLMEDMQIADTDLLDFETVKSLLLQAKGAEDVSVLLTDEQLLTDVQNLEANFTQIVENVQETLSVTEEDMTVLKEQFSQMNQTKEPVITVETNVEAEVITTKPQESEQPKEGSTDNQQTFQWNGQNPATVAESVNSTGSVEQMQSSYSAVQTADIMNQIMDYMKIQLNAESSFLEMQLQPESLGTLQIRISAKEGLMTAQFTTANDSVKAVLEGQMVQLQQQLESQNIKVDAIEVMVEPHAFESALQQGEERQQAGEEKKNRTRKIDLNSFDDSGELVEEDRIVAEMMAANGNTVDYLA